MPELENTIRITTVAEKWRLECPRGELGEGHTNWFPIDGVFRCQGCAEQARHDPTITPEYPRLRDKKTGELVPRDRVVLDVKPRPTATGV